MQLYLGNKISKSWRQTKHSFKQFNRSEAAYSWRNLLYDLAGWSGVLGLMVGAVYRWHEQKKSGQV